MTMALYSKAVKRSSSRTKRSRPLPQTPNRSPRFLRSIRIDSNSPSSRTL